MPIHISVDVSGVKDALAKFSANVAQSLEIAMDVAGRKIMETLKADQLSGRRAPNYGLNRRTGNLYESLRSGAYQKGNSFISEVYNRGAQYWEYHERAMGFNPKRLWFEEYFRKSGPDVYASEIEVALGRV